MRSWKRNLTEIKTLDSLPEAAAPKFTEFRPFKRVSDEEWDARFKYVSKRWQGGWSTQEIGETIDTSREAITQWLIRARKEGNPAILEADRVRANRLAKKKSKTKAKTLEERFIDEFGRSPEDVSRENMRLFYAEEIQDHKAGKKIDEGVRSTLYRYGLIPFPPGHTRPPRGRPKNG